MPIEPSNQEKQVVWDLYKAGAPTRVPVVLTTNNRVYVLNERFNEKGVTYRDIFNDPREMFDAQLKWQKLLHSLYHHYCDFPTGIPDRWQIVTHFHNVYEAWFLGCEVSYQADQVPDTIPRYAGDNKRAVFDVDIDHPLEREPFSRGIQFTERMVELARSYEFEGRPVEVLPYVNIVSDGPFTVALKVRGPEFLMDCIEDPAYADDLMAFINQAAINRSRALLEYYGRHVDDVLWLGDDAIQMISPDMYVKRVMRHHRHFYDSLDPDHKQPRLMHLCGNAYRHFPAIVEGCGVNCIDTGFPVDLPWLREAVGPAIEIWAGVEVSLLLSGTPDQVAARTIEVLESGVLEGKRFIMREANNLPPSVPEENLAAMYNTTLEHGRFGLE